MKRMLILVLAAAGLILVGCADKTDPEPKSKEPVEEAPAVPSRSPATEAPAVPSLEPATEVPSVPSLEPATEVPSVPSREPATEVPAVPSREPATVVPAVPTPPPLPKLELMPLDLSTIDSTVKLVLMVPAGAAARDDYGSIEIAKEPDFQMEFSEEDEVDFLARKKEIEASTINKLKKYHVDTPDTLLYETEIMGKSEFHFVATITVGETLYLCEDQKGPVFSQSAISAMLAACRSARAKGYDLPMPALDGNPGLAMPRIDLE